MGKGLLFVLFTVVALCSIMGAAAEEIVVVRDASSPLRIQATARVADSSTEAFPDAPSFPVARDYEIITLDVDDVNEAIREIADEPGVLAVSRNVIYRTFGTVPNDDHIDTALSRISAQQAWDIEQGDASVIIAVIDTGVEWNHTDLAANIWNNTDEIPNNSIDDDGNGYVDDVRGWDFVSSSVGCTDVDCSGEDNDPMDYQSHGTHVAGIIAGKFNNSEGITGVCGHCTIMPLRAGYANGSSGALSTTAIYNAILYAADNNASIISMSFGSTSPSVIATALDAAEAAGLLLVGSAGNSGTSVENYPAAYSNVIAVAAVNNSDARAYFSQYGSWISIAAPGVSINSTIPGFDYGLKSGTSMSAPMVSGALGLYLSQFGTLGNNASFNVLNLTGDTISTDQNVGRRLNASRLLCSPAGVSSWNLSNTAFSCQRAHPHVNGTWRVWNDSSISFASANMSAQDLDVRAYLLVSGSNISGAIDLHADQSNFTAVGGSNVTATVTIFAGLLNASGSTLAQVDARNGTVMAVNSTIALLYTVPSNTTYDIVGLTTGSMSSSSYMRMVTPLIFYNFTNGTIVQHNVRPSGGSYGNITNSTITSLVLSGESTGVLTNVSVSGSTITMGSISHLNATDTTFSGSVHHQETQGTHIYIDSSLSSLTHTGGSGSLYISGTNWSSLINVSTNITTTLTDSSGESLVLGGTNVTNANHTATTTFSNVSVALVEINALVGNVSLTRSNITALHLFLRNASHTIGLSQGFGLSTIWDLANLSIILNETNVTSLYLLTGRDMELNVTSGALAGINVRNGSSIVFIDGSSVGHLNFTGLHNRSNLTSSTLNRTHGVFNGSTTLLRNMTIPANMTFDDAIVTVHNSTLSGYITLLGSTVFNVTNSTLDISKVTAGSGATLIYREPNVTLHRPVEGRSYNVTRLRTLLNATFSHSIAVVNYTIGSVTRNISFNGTSLVSNITLLNYGNTTLILRYADEFGLSNSTTITFRTNLSFFNATINDTDGDGINDTNDTLVGTGDNIEHNFENVSVEVNGTTSLNQTFNSSINVTLRRSGALLVVAFHNFSSRTLNLTGVVIRNDSVANSSRLLVRGLNVTQNKTIYLTLLGNTSRLRSICVKDAAIDDISQVSATCNGTNETYVTIPSSSGIRANFTSATNRTVAIYGLRHSGVVQQCTESWSCGDWSSCSSSTQTRTCTDANSCGTTHNKPATSQSCSSDSSGTSGGGGGGGGGFAIPYQDLSVSDSSSTSAIRFRRYYNVTFAGDTHELFIYRVGENISVRLPTQDNKIYSTTSGTLDIPEFAWEVTFENLHSLGADMRIVKKVVPVITGATIDEVTGDDADDGNRDVGASQTIVSSEVIEVSEEEKTFPWMIATIILVVAIFLFGGIGGWWYYRANRVYQLWSK